MTAPDDPPEHERAPRGWQAQAGRLSTIGLKATYHAGRILQRPFGAACAVFWRADDRLAKMDAEIERRKGGK